MAGRGGAARAAARAIRGCSENDPVPWHRVVSASGAYYPGREALQHTRLVEEGARPAPGERSEAWARRRGLFCIGNIRSKVFYPPGSTVLQKISSEQLEGFRSAPQARTRGYRRPGETRPPDAEPPNTPIHGLPKLGTLHIDRKAAACSLRKEGYYHQPDFLGEAQRIGLLSLCAQAEWRKQTDMNRTGGGRGLYCTFASLPPTVRGLADELYIESKEAAESIQGPRAKKLPKSLESFEKICRARGQSRQASILLCYGPEGRNHPHQDLYGPVVHPLQAMVLLSRPGEDFTGGDFLLQEERIGHADHVKRIPVDSGALVLFPSHRRYAADGRRYDVRHGMSELQSGSRYCLGIVFHLAR
jgi:uncharacterized protein